MMQAPSEHEPPERDPLPPVIWVEYQPSPDIVKDFHKAKENRRVKEGIRTILWLLLLPASIIAFVMIANHYNSQNASSSLPAPAASQNVVKTILIFVSIITLTISLLSLLAVVVNWITIGRYKKELANSPLFRWRLMDGDITFYHDTVSIQRPWNTFINAIGFKTGYLLVTTKKVELWISAKGFKDITHERQVALRLKRHIPDCVGFTVLQCQGCKYDLSRSILDGKANCPECGRDVSAT